MWRKKLWKKNKMNFIKPGQMYEKKWQDHANNISNSKNGN